MRWPIQGKENEQQGLAFLALLSGAFCIGIAPILVRLSPLEALPTAFYRLLLALPCLWLWPWLISWHQQGNQSGGYPKLRHQGGTGGHWGLIVLSGICFGLDMACWHEALHQTSVANATLLTNTAPLFVTIAAWFLFGERLPPFFLAGMVLTMVGGVMLTGFHLDGLGKPQQGDLMALLAAIFYAGYMLSVKRLRDSMDTMPLLARSGLFSTLTLGILCLIGNHKMLPSQGSGWLPLLGLALCGQVLGQGLIAFGFKHLPASFAALSLLLQPFVAALAAWLILNEAMTPVAFIGGALILAGILVSRRVSHGTKENSG
ncbi:MAG: DMT family transporter [Verrucomicrobia bacterium]|jgi:drug/metabolite transporter (DMT)-like permease|nr:DMT family transporter [Verrucomicrobiota bacterium]